VTGVLGDDGVEPVPLLPPPSRARILHRLGGSVYRLDAITTSAASAGSFALTLASAVVLARVLGPEGRGDIAAVLSTSIFLSWLIPVGLPLAAAYHVDEDSEGRLVMTTTAFGLVEGVVVAAVLWFLFPVLLHEHSATSLWWARFMLLFLPLTVGAQSVLEIERRRRPGLAWNGWRSCSLIVPAIGILALAPMGWLTLNTALGVTFLGNALPLILVINRLWRARGDRPSMGTLRTIMPYAWRSAATTASSALTARLDQVVLAAGVPADRLGLYAVAVTAASLSTPLTSGLNLALFGHLRNEADADRAAARFRRTVVVTVVLSGLVAAMTAVFAPLIIELAFGSKFRAATAPLRLLLPGQVAIEVSKVLITKLNAEGRPGEASRASVVGALLTVAGLALLVPPFGIAGAAAATTLAWVGQVGYMVHRGALTSVSAAHRH
jgi:enterobacterial common antigen flippase